MKILILAYDFPPLISIGAQRPYSWYKYLPAAQGIKAGQAGPPDTRISVTVVTRQWNEKTSSPLDYVAEMPQKAYQEFDNKGNVIIRAPFFPNKRDKMLVRFGFAKLALLRKLLTYFYSFFEHFFFVFDNKATIYIEAQKTIEQNRPDFIIATAEPFILFKYAHLLSAKYNIPWVADYRDGWNTNQGNYNRGVLSKLLSSFYTVREKKYINNSLFITTASPTYAVALQKLHPDKEIKVVYNGYDEEYLKGLDEVLPAKDKFTISYAGTVYPHQNLEMFLDGLSMFIGNEKIAADKLQIYFYGIESQQQALNRLLNYNHALREYIVATNKIPYGGLLKKLRASHLLLLLSKKDAQWLNAKVFDYMAVKRKIILIENDKGILEKLLKDTQSGDSLNNAEDVCQYLKQQYALFKQGNDIEVPANAETAKYSRKNQAGVLFGLLKEKFRATQGK